MLNRRSRTKFLTGPDQTLRQDPFSGTVLVFRAKRADRVKIDKRAV